VNPGSEPRERRAGRRASIVRATVTPLASILGSGLLIIEPVLERTLGALAVLGAIGICVVAWFVGTVIRHNVRVVESREARGLLDAGTARWGRVADAVIVVAYVISVALYLRIMAQYLVGLVVPAGSAFWEPVIACAAVVLIVGIGVLRGFAGLDRLDRWSLVTVLALTGAFGVILLVHDGTAVAAGSLALPPVPDAAPLGVLAVLGGIVITVQGFETVRYLGDEYDAATRVRASRWAQLIAAAIYIVIVAAATPAMGLGTPAGPSSTLLDIAARIAPWFAVPLVLSAVFSQFSAGIADTAAAEGNLRGLSPWFRGRRPYLLSGAAAILLAATVPTLTIVAVASRAFAVYYAIQAVIAFRTSSGIARRTGFAALGVLMLAVAVFALPAG
jgi:hypothetical protein